MIKKKRPLEPGPILTSRGKWIHPYKPHELDVDVMEIIRVNAKRCRFGGFCKYFLSVAQHSVTVTDLTARLIEGRTEYAEPRVRQRILLRALFHDAGEVYAGCDAMRPLIPIYGQYKVVERMFRERVYESLGIASPVSHLDQNLVKIADDAALIHEARHTMPAAFFDHAPPLKMNIDHLPPLECLEWADAARRMQSRYIEIVGR